MAEQRNGAAKPSDAASGGGYAIDMGNFVKRLKAFYGEWKERRADVWGGSEAVAVATPPSSEDLRYLKSSALNIWLLGYEFPETVMVFMKKQIHFLCSQKKASLLETLKQSARDAVGADVVLHVKARSDDGAAAMDDVLRAVRVQSGVDSPVVGYIAREAPEGQLLESWIGKLKASNLQLVDVTNGFSNLFSLKDETELTCSGGEFDLRPSATSNDENLYYESTSVIVCAIGARYLSYCSNVARTFLIDANPTQSKAYEVLLKAQDAAISALRPGNKVSAAYQAAVSIVEKESPELLANLTKSAGTGIGLEFRESGLGLNAKNDRLVKSGMNLQAPTKNLKTEKFSLLLADTVIVTDKSPEILTSPCSKAVKDVAYSFNEEDEEEVSRGKVETTGIEVLPSKATLRSDNQEMSKEEVRKLHQAELARQKNEETARRLAGVSANGDGRGHARASGELVAYKNVNDIPQSKELVIQVDQRNEAVLLPIYGSLVPFHISTVKSVNSNQDNRTCTIRIIFNVPGAPFAPPPDANTSRNQSAIFLKEVTFRSKDPRHSSEVVQLIKTLRRQVASRESEKAERATLVTQEKLQLAGAKMKPTRLSDLWIRPPFGGRGRKLSGTLEAHINGFRFSTSRSEERVDIMYGNIKHAFFQPAEKEMITLVHLHLHNHIMVGNKKTKDVQFYVEVMDVVQTLGGGRRSAMDPDEIEEEQRERERKNRINMEFQNFVNKVHDHWGQPQFKGLDLEFDQPLRELGFHGVPYKASVFVIPTSSCLVELIETPFLVITLSEIEIVNLERVGFGQKNFDMAIVFKDFKKDAMRIDSIPMSAVDGIKEWLDTTDIKYYESRMNLNWRPILKTITDDPEKFIEDGGWEFLNMEASDSDTQNSEDSDQGYEPSDVEPESASDDEGDDSESLVESDEDEEDSDEDSDDEKGKTWEELEREASNADREKGDQSDSEEERRRRKAKTLGKSRIPERGGPAKKPKMR
ncbi:hypothetical protein Taro_043879 [Colocasia esculenta]|uniref:FACT complex subunit n=1 Tax=Colocasia esculenta TaxID=4460 RepID=A0A843X2C6_COLES|nr:hypothetical protein [Colocasia esculenta]